VERKLPFDMVLIDGWYLAPDLVQEIETQYKDWMGILKKNRKLETNSFTLRDAQGEKISLDAPLVSLAIISYCGYRNAADAHRFFSGDIIITFRMTLSANPRL
jgi:hypothetical protein